MKKFYRIFVALCICYQPLSAQKLLPFKLPDTGQDSSFSANAGEDADFVINPMSFTDNGDGTVTDNNTGLMWQKTDGGEMTYENAKLYCKNLRLAGHKDWRLPLNKELFSINRYDCINPALNTFVFTKTLAEYWYTSELQADDTTKVWLVNSGGGTGAHLRTETMSAGGTRRFHVRAVRDIYGTIFSINHFTDNGDGTIKDNYTGLTWQKIPAPDTMTWDDALKYASSLALAGKTDWRLPNIKELQSLSDETLFKPSFNQTYFSKIVVGNYWSSTTLFQNPPVKAWYLNTEYGLATYRLKTAKQYVICVRGGFDNTDLNLEEVIIPSGIDSMGDHFNFTDPKHPSDERPVHAVKTDTLYMAVNITTNQQFVTFLNDLKLKGLIEVRGDSAVYPVGGTDMYCYLHNYALYYSIAWDGHVFSIADFRAYHPVVGVMWCGAAAFCNWLSSLYGLDNCFDLTTWNCDFSKNGYRLPTEAEWEWAARGGHTNPFYQYINGDTAKINQANLPDSGDPYESANTSLYPFTTPVGFYDGSLKLKSGYNWPGNAPSYQTSNGKNGFGLYDMQGNVWQFIYDWYKTDYYSVSPYLNPAGPDKSGASLMPDGKPYRGMRGGNWFNGDMVYGINDGHSRVSNRDPLYYRGPGGTSAPWHHEGFRVARNFNKNETGIIEVKSDVTGCSVQIYPNPVKLSATINLQLNQPGEISLKIINSLGQSEQVIMNRNFEKGRYDFTMDTKNKPSGVYTLVLQYGSEVIVKKFLIVK